MKKSVYITLVFINSGCPTDFVLPGNVEYALLSNIDTERFYMSLSEHLKH